MPIHGRVRTQVCIGAIRWHEREVAQQQTRCRKTHISLTMKSASRVANDLALYGSCPLIITITLPITVPQQTIDLSLTAACRPTYCTAVLPYCLSLYTQLIFSHLIQPVVYLIQRYMISHNLFTIECRYQLETFM